VAKIDKDLLLKHRFWILVGLSVPCVLIAILLLATSVSGSIAQKRKSLETDLQKISTAKATKPQDVEDKKVEANLLVSEETKAWGKAYKLQQAIYRWPTSIEEIYHLGDGVFANEIHLLKLPAEKGGWPADSAEQELIHGTLVVGPSLNEQGFEIVDRDGKKHAFFVTPRLLREGLVDEEDGKKVQEYQNLLSKNTKDTLVAVSYQKTRYFNDRLTKNEQFDYKKYYLSQIPAIIRQVDPVHVETENGKPVIAGVVQFGSGWKFDVAADREYRDDGDKKELTETQRDKLIPPPNTRFLRFLDKREGWDTTHDISTEAWIAQEDLWIQKEIYRLVRLANDSVSAFTPISRDDAKRTATYQNPYFEIKLTLKDAKSLDVQITNRLQRRQKVEGMKLRVRFQKRDEAEPEEFYLVTDSKYADPLEPRDNPKKVGHTRTIPVHFTGGKAREGIYSLEQVLTWETAAVKRIDHISIGADDSSDMGLSQKNTSIGVKPYREPEKKEGAADPKSGGGLGAPGAAGSGAGGVGLSGSGPGAGGGGKGESVLASTRLANGLMLERYLEVTSQFRRIPVAVVLIVDQNHVDRVQTAFNNSSLRFLMSQVLLNHYPKSLKPELPTEKAAESGGGGGTSAGGGLLGPPGSSGSGASGAAGSNYDPYKGTGGKKGGSTLGGPSGTGSGAGASLGGSGPGGAGAGSSGNSASLGATDDLEANMELVLYGVVTLYERYPPRGNPAAAGIQPKTP
jgi:hypothetical protein